MVNERGIEANPEKIEALCKMRSPQKPKEVQSLIGRVATLSCFISKATDKCLPFFKLLKVGKEFQWIEKCEEAFQLLKRHLGQAPLLSKPKPSEILQLYLAISNEAIITVLIREEGMTQLPAVELSKFDLVFKAREAIKGQALVDFVAEFANLPEVDEIMENVEPPTWNLFMDGSSGKIGSGAEVVLISLKGHKLNSAIMFRFKATNNVAEYEALLLSLGLAREMQVKRLLISSDSQLVVSQWQGLQTTHNSTIEHLLIPSTEAPNVMWVAETQGRPTWMQPILAYLKDQVHPANKHEAYKLRRRLAHFLFIDDVLYKRSFSSPLLRCMGGEEATYILREVYEGVCGNHSGGLSLAQKILRQGYYWPTLKKYALQFVGKCDKCQRFSPIQRQPSQDLTEVSSPWPFSKWDMDIIGPLPKRQTPPSSCGKTLYASLGFPTQSSQTMVNS
ncbi:uncharacterized protein LOC111371032 [Olea europaea var. sylvestris]|uniref:uncharacterized protein LOC111371032 n=1 Tax=Olea europaea var. sylvestris TaxID=158386 RepID=UPI000C1CF88C|nr:uncharacterized protein LOC111371032 [Olea europaea var. sylvestris]